MRPGSCASWLTPNVRQGWPAAPEDLEAGAAGTHEEYKEVVGGDFALHRPKVPLKGSEQVSGTKELKETNQAQGPQRAVAQPDECGHGLLSHFRVLLKAVD